ncbi:MAG: GGDEF domain-containing protein [Henriciella sp.]|nr:GGDEF domain-containing protein [Henriciella sp.]
MGLDMPTDIHKLKETAIFFAMVVATALALSFIVAVVMYNFGVSDHSQKYLLTSVYISVCVGLPVAIIASQNQFRLMMHRDPLETLATRDGLTDLLSRRYFLQAANQQIQRMQRTEKMAGVIVFDIDGFKDINDKFGNAMGDKLLMAVATLAREELRSRQDLMTRWWGDEFVIMLHATTPELVRLVSERVRKRIDETPIMLGDNEVKVTASFGFAVLSKYDTLEGAMGRADEAMKLAKSEGKNTVRTWSIAQLAS